MVNPLYTQCLWAQAPLENPPRTSAGLSLKLEKPIRLGWPFTGPYYILPLIIGPQRILFANIYQRLPSANLEYIYIYIYHNAVFVVMRQWFQIPLLSVVSAKLP